MNIQLVIKRGTEVVLDEPVQPPSRFIYELLSPIVKVDEQVEVRGVAFIPDESLKVGIKRGGYTLEQNNFELADDVVSVPLELVLVPRIIIQHERLNPLVSSKSVFLIMKLPGKTVYVDNKVCFCALFGQIKKLVTRGNKVTHSERKFSAIEKLSAERDGKSWSIRSDKTSRLTPVHLYFELTVESEYIYVDNSFFENDLATLIRVFYNKAKRMNTDVETLALERRTDALAIHGICWIKVLEHVCSIANFPALLELVKTELPFYPSSQDFQENFGPVDAEQQLSEDATLRSIVWPIINTLGNYSNVDLNEANVNSRLWTPILDGLLIPNLVNRKSLLNSAVEYRLRTIKASVKDIRIDYALLGKDLYPLLLAEYAKEHEDRSVSKDFTKLAIAMASFLLDFIGKHRGTPELLKLLKGFLLYISATQMELAIIRPLFDKDMKLRGFTLRTDKNWMFDLQQANPQRNLDVVVDFAPCDTYTLSPEDMARIHRRIEEKLKGAADIPRVVVEERSIDCPEALDLSSIDFDTLKFIRGMGLYLHDLAQKLTQTLDDHPSSHDGPYVYSVALQKSFYTQAIPETVTPHAKQNKNPGTPSPRKGKLPLQKSLKILKKKYGWEVVALAKIKTTRKGAIVKMPVQKHVRSKFILKTIDEQEWYFLSNYGKALSDIIPKLGPLERFQTENFMLVGNEGLRSLKHQFESDGGIATIWMFHMPEKVGALLVDVIMAIDKLHQEGLVHGNICLKTIVYSKLHHYWVLTGFDHVGPVQTHRGVTPQSDLQDLARVADWIVEDIGKYRVELSCPNFFEYLSPDLATLREFLAFLKTGPSVLQALEAVHEYYTPYRRCSNVDVKFNKLRFRRLQAAIKQLQPMAMSPIIAPAATLICVASSLKQPTSAMSPDDQENLSANQIIED